MTKLRNSWIVVMLALALGFASAQDTSAPPATTAPQDNGSQQQEQPLPAYGQQGASTPITENPPISGLDLPGLEPHAAPLSYLQPGATVSESIDSNVENVPGSGTAQSISRAVGSIALQRLWSHYDLAAQYMGGVAYYNLEGIGWKALQQFDVEQKITWKRGQLSVRDSFSYLPEGNFGAAYGSLGSEGIASLGNTAFGSFWGGSTLGTLGLVPRITNISLADVTENLTPKSAVTAAGGYAVTHFYGTDPNTGISYLNNTQVSAQIGYDRILTSHTQIAFVYGYQGFDFSSVGTAFHSHVFQAMYGHRISGRMDFLIGAGPQITLIGECTVFVVTCLTPEIPDTRIGVAGRARLRYQLRRTSLDLSYERFETSGSGFFAGAQTDIAQLRADHPINRVWSAFADLGFTGNSRSQLASEGVNAARYDYAFAGGGVHRPFGRNFHAFVSYQFNELIFDHSFCTPASACNRISNRHVGTIGVDWTPRPIRLD
jgi:hypothetical protein